MNAEPAGAESVLRNRKLLRDQLVATYESEFITADESYPPDVWEYLVLPGWGDLTTLLRRSIRINAGLRAVRDGTVLNRGEEYPPDIETYTYEVLEGDQ